MKHNGTAIRIRGRVQGVGFRPFVWQLAGELGRTGDVSNDAEGVLVHLVGDEAGFIARLRERCPPWRASTMSWLTPGSGRPCRRASAFCRAGRAA